MRIQQKKIQKVFKFKNRLLKRKKIIQKKTLFTKPKIDISSQVNFQCQN